MRMTTIKPSSAVAGLVRTFIAVETDTEAVRTLIPETGAVLGIRYQGSATLIASGGEVALPDVTLTGMRNVVRRMRTSAGGGVIVTCFCEDGASALFGRQMHLLFNEIIGPEQFASAEALETLRIAVKNAPDLATRVRTLEQFLLGYRPVERDHAVLAAVRAMRSVRGAISIRSLAAGLGMSQDRFEKRFRRIIGTSPKQYCSLLRLRWALQGVGRESLAALALESGYYDQSHFIREFRSVMGAAPGRFLRNTEYC